MWTEHRNPEGRTYWFNTATKQSVWEKPDDLKTPFEKALNQTKWKEYFSGGRKYYYNTESKESKWDMPDELLLLLEKVEKESAASTTAVAAPKALPPAGFSNTLVPASSVPANGVTTPTTQQSTPTPQASGAIPSRPNLPEDPVVPHNGFATFEEGEKAFMHLLRKAGVDVNWTWDQTMRAIITDPLYRALNSLSEKKATFEKFVTNLKVKEQEEKESRLARLRPALKNLLKGNPNVFHYTTFATADKVFSQHPIWQQARIEAERKLIFEEYVSELKQQEVQASREAKRRATSKLVSIFKNLEVDVLTRWRDVHHLIPKSEEWKSDPELQRLPNLDILLAFEDYSRLAEREWDEQTRRAQVEKIRRERKAREAFKELLQDLVAHGKIKARTKWKDVYPLFSTDKRYLDMLGNPGSNQLELFWDVVDGLDQKLDAKIDVVTDVIKRHTGSKTDEGGDVEMNGETEDTSFKVTPETEESEFRGILQASRDPALDQLAEADLHEIFVTLHDVAVKKRADEKRRAERKQRHLQDDLRYAMKKLPEPIDINMTYDQVVPLIENLPEYKAIEEDDGRRAAFAKFVKRQKERMREAAVSEDGGSTSGRKRKERDYDAETERPARDRDREREREKDRDRDSHRERERDKDKERDRDRGKDYEKDSRSRHHSRYEDFDTRRSSREYGRDREDRDHDKDKDSYKSSKHGHSRDDREDRKRDKGRDRDRERDKEKHSRDWDESPKRERARSRSAYKEDVREKRDHDDRVSDDRVEKKLRLDRDDEAMEVDIKSNAREETPEEGEI